MIITRSPLRITLGGGGTDLPVYCSKFGADLLVATIDKYVYVTIHDSFYESHLLKYSDYEKVNNVNEIKHPILREVLITYEPSHPIEVTSLADIPGGTGMGSSSAFTCALLLAMHTMKNEVVSKNEIAEEACHIEIDMLNEPIGKQDQYATSFGGINNLIIDRDGSVNMLKIGITKDTCMNLQSNILIFFTGHSRDASNILKKEQNADDIVFKLHRIKEIGMESKKALVTNDLDRFGRLMDEHWKIKHSTTNSMSDYRIDELYNLAKYAGALGGKLIGAGGGGFLMFYTNYPKQLRDVMNKEGLKELNWKFESYGSHVMMI